MGQVRRHQPQAQRKPSATAMQAALRARAELYSDAPGYTPEEALAERERFRIETEAKAQRQQVLPFGTMQ